MREAYVQSVVSDGLYGARFSHHCCDSIAPAMILKGHILYFRKRFIKKGEELAID